MPVFRELLTHATRGQGTYELTRELQRIVAASGIHEGLVNVHCQHTSCSLVLMENADPSAREDLHAFMQRLVPDDAPYFTHTYEGPDDMPSHIKMALTRSNETLPVEGGRILLGTWQGLFLWEHRDQPHHRQVTVTVMGEAR